MQGAKEVSTERRHGEPVRKGVVADDRPIREGIRVKVVQVIARNGVKVSEILDGPACGQRAFSQSVKGLQVERWPEIDAHVRRDRERELIRFGRDRRTIVAPNHPASMSRE